MCLKLHNNNGLQLFSAQPGLDITPTWARNCTNRPTKKKPVAFARALIAKTLEFVFLGISPTLAAAAKFYCKRLGKDRSAISGKSLKGFTTALAKSHPGVLNSAVWRAAISITIRLPLTCPNGLG